MSIAKWAAGWLLCAGAQAASLYFPAPEAIDDERSDYQLTLLRLAFEKSHAGYTVERTHAYMPQGRALDELAKGSGLVQVVASMTSAEREARLLPIRIPIFKGLIGWRIPLVPADEPDLLAHVRSKADLARLRAGQGADWPDTAILRANGLPVESAIGYAGMFKMLGLHRFDYFPRSVAEIMPEVRQHLNDGVVMDRHVVLHYPAAVYFFVNRKDTALAKAIRRGLEAALADGSFDRLFYAHHRAFIDLADLPHRRVIELDNPLLPAETPLARAALWYRPGAAH